MDLGGAEVGPEAHAMRIFLLALIALLLLALARPALATDGVAEINHTCAAQTGCFRGDTAGYPVTIDGTAGLLCLAALPWIRKRDVAT